MNVVPRLAKTCGRLLGRPLLLFPMPLVLIVADVLLDKKLAFQGWNATQWGIWSTGMAWDLSAWALLALLLAQLRHSRYSFVRVASFVLMWVSAGVHSAAIAISAGYVAVFHHLPNIHALEFAINEPANAWTMFLDAFDVRGAAWFALSIPLFAWLHALASRGWHPISRVHSPALRRALKLAPLLVATGVSSFALGWHRFQEPLPLGAAWSRVFFQYALQASGNRTDLQRPVRMAISPPANPAPVNVLVILHESLRADALEVLPDSLFEGFDARSLAPRTLARQKDTSSWVLPHARSNATATAVSVSSWTTGVPPWGSTYDLHRSPTLFDAAHAAGRRTFLLTAQDWHWWHLDEFFFGPSLSRVVDRSSFDAPKVNDLGVDDALLVDSLAALATESDTPFVALLQFNANHGPYYTGPHGPDLPPSSRERYAASVRYIDSVQEECLRVLDSAGVLDRTLVIQVSDHAENLGSRDIARINAFYDEAVRIPFWVRLPRTGIDLRAASASLDAWKDRNVDLLDIAPTILDVLGYPPESGARSLQKGSSLLRPPPDTLRVLGGQSTGDVRSWDIEGAYVMKGPLKFVLHQGRGPMLFDLSKDPRETTDLWSQPAHRDEALSWLRPAFALPGRADLCRRAGKDCPEPLRDLDRRTP